MLPRLLECGQALVAGKVVRLSGETFSARGTSAAYLRQRCPHIKWPSNEGLMLEGSPKE